MVRRLFANVFVSLLCMSTVFYATSCVDDPKTYNDTDIYMELKFYNEEDFGQKVYHTGISAMNFIPEYEDLKYDYSSIDFSEIGANTLTVVVLPVYAGHLPQLAVLRMAGLRAAGAPAVAVVVYGNRAYEKSLVELNAFLSGKGFGVIAAGTFVGEHSYSTVSCPIASGRPDKNDLEEATDFGRRIRQKVKNRVVTEASWVVDVSRIRRPYQPLLPLFCFIYEAARLRKRGRPMPATPCVDESLCTHCGRCVKTCPNNAIMKGDECHTISERCIRCCACVKGCPQKARLFDSPFAVLLSKYFKRQKQNRVIL